MADENACRDSIELRCAGCGEIVSCHGPGFTYIASELIDNDHLGFGALVSALILSGWEFSVEQFVVNGNPRIAVQGRPVNPFGRPRLDKRDVTALWERRTDGWVPGERMTGHQAIGGGLFVSATANELATLVSADKASWVRIPR
ncbi:hypothetical protein [Nocardia transvalensis]|uniref:hypothetical protein n=1 Tax=Nocardia transvalensis TaxID=37333 RepID=UPI00189600F2|nr:hypothetical protein [Nocardia transvalensis]MBF6333339.1 hypothetical protein [Nocardia transvalensis]